GDDGECPVVRMVVGDGPLPRENRRRGGRRGGRLENRGVVGFVQRGRDQRERRRVGHDSLPSHAARRSATTSRCWSAVSSWNSGSIRPCRWLRSLVSRL